MTENSKSSISLDYRSKMTNHYKPLVSKFGYDFRSNDWGSDNSQFLRYQVLLESMQYQNLRILDIGCGTGHMVSYLKQNRFAGVYLGVDIVPDMISNAQQQHPDFSFQLISSFSDILSFSPDFVVASGIFTFVDQRMFFLTIAELFDLTKKALAFNALSLWKSHPESNEFHADPIETLQYCSTITPNISLKHNYLPHDFTVAMYK